MLASLQEQGYIVEWRIINAAEYGFPQRRKRVFIFATLESIGKNIYNFDSNQIALEKGFFSKEFPVSQEISEFKQIELKYKDLIEVTNSFSFGFENYGYLINNTIYTTKVKSAFNGVTKTLGDILDFSTEKTPYLINNIEKWEYLKSAKKIARTSKTGFTYNFSEGPVAFPDKLDRPARTMLTSESSLNRSSHVIYESKLKAYRTLTPLEAERLNGFPDNWTEGISDKRRYFMMGNALVVGIVFKLSKSLNEFISLIS
jgi:DNA (cytosine-5)-methyltransferase 1